MQRGWKCEDAKRLGKCEVIKGMGNCKVGKCDVVRGCQLTL